ncbi:MAG TPA: cupin domain-containing protein [Actinomycetota bacterium]|nr:cupin domain-containing protein [Actinomycetota bacterium]
MEYGEAIIVDHLSSAETDQSQLVIYDREIGVRLLYQDPESGAEHYLIRYPAGLKARVHRHTAAQTIVVLEGRLVVNDQVIGPGAFCHFPPGETMFHAPADDKQCLFISIFHGPADVEPLEGK